MDKKIIFLGLGIIICALIYFYFKQGPSRIKIAQNNYCFCSTKDDPPLTACFHPTSGAYAAWNSHFDLALMPFKFPFITGTWKKIKNDIKITFSDSREFYVPFNPETDGLYPGSLNIYNQLLKPKNCENSEFSDISKNSQFSKDFGYFCTDDKKGPPLNIQINFRDKSFKTWVGDILFSKESIFLEAPSKSGVFDMEGNEFKFKFTDGLERKGKVIQRESENKNPLIIEFGSGDTTILADREKCKWMDNSLAQIPLLNSENILCEKDKKDNLAIILPNQKINMYLNTRDFTLKDFINDKVTFEGTNLLFIGNKISFDLKGSKRNGFYEKIGEKIKSLKFPSGKPNEWLEYSKDFCAPFYLSNVKIPNK